VRQATINAIENEQTTGTDFAALARLGVDLASSWSASLGSAPGAQG
jgi:hypothetical protein